MKNEIFAPVLGIIAEYRRISDELTALRDQQQKAHEAYRAELMAMHRAIRDDNPDAPRFNAAAAEKFSAAAAEKRAAYHEADTRISAEIQLREIILPIIRDNARAVAADILRPHIAALLQRYAGKRPGEKTREKMRHEFLDIAGMVFYFDRENHFGVSDPQTYANGNFTAPFFGYNDLVFDARLAFLIDENGKINAIPADALEIAIDKPEFVDDPAARAAEIIAAFHAMEHAQEVFQQRVSEFNALLPSRGIERLYTPHVRGYIK